MESVERIRDFLDTGSDSGSGSGYGYGSGDGLGSGDGSGYCSGSGDGSGYCSGSGDGDGDGYVSGYGSDSGSGDIKEFCGASVFYVDGLPTIIDRIHAGFAFARIVKIDLTTKRCFVAKVSGVFAHGSTLRKALESAREKLFDDMSAEDLVLAFLDEHPDDDREYHCRDLYEWHHRLTGSCEMGRKTFAKEHGIDVDNDKMTLNRFVDLTRDAYGGDVIRLLGKALRERKK